MKMGDLSQLQTLLTIAGIIMGFLGFLLVIIVTNIVGKSKEKMYEKIEMKFAEMKKEMHDTMVTKDFFNGKFELLNQKIDMIIKRGDNGERK